MHKTKAAILAKLPADGSEIKIESLSHASELAKAGLIAFRVVTDPRRGKYGRAIFRYLAAITPAGIAARGGV